MRHAKKRYLTWFAAIGFALGSASQAQQAAKNRRESFTVAAIKPSVAGTEGFSHASGGLPGGQFILTNTSLERWLEMAFSVTKDQLQSPHWAQTANFDLTARLPEGNIDQKSIAAMMTSLLQERFGLTWHRESRQVPGYELRVDKKLLLKPSGAVDRLRGHGSSSGPAFIGGTNISMSELAAALEEATGRPVVDATHNTELFDIKLNWRASDDAVLASQRTYGKKYGVDVDSLPSSIEEALKEQLGLRLYSTKMQSQIVVIDHLARQPSPN